MNIKNKQSGVTLLLALLILSSIMAISFSLATILFVEVRTSADLLRTEEALYGAQGVSEQVLFAVKRKVPNYQPSANAYATSTTDGRVAMNSTSSLYSDPQGIRDIIPTSAKDLTTAKRYPLLDPDCPVPLDPNDSRNGAILAQKPYCAHAGSGYKSIKITYLDTGTNSALKVYICEYDPSGGTSYHTPVCTDASDYGGLIDGINYGYYWNVKDYPIYANFYQQWNFNSGNNTQQELILINDSASAYVTRPGDIYVQIQAFSLDSGTGLLTAKGLPYIDQTVVDTNAANNGVNRKLRTIVPNN